MDISEFVETFQASLSFQTMKFQRFSRKWILKMFNYSNRHFLAFSRHFLRLIRLISKVWTCGAQKFPCFIFYFFLENFRTSMAEIYTSFIYFFLFTMALIHSHRFHPQHNKCQFLNKAKDKASRVSGRPSQAGVQQTSAGLLRQEHYGA